MASFSTYFAGEILNWLKGTTFDAAPAGVYVSLHSADPGLTGSNEVTTTVSAARPQATFGAIASKRIENSVDVEFGNSLGSVTVTHFGLWDAASAGNFLGGDALDNSRAIVTDDPVLFLTGDLAVQL